MKATLILVIDDIQPDLDPAIVRRIQAATRRVRLDTEGFFRKGGNPCKPGNPRTSVKGTEDWRYSYARMMKRIFPNAWIYRGGHHLAIHASPPPNRQARRWEDGGCEAGRCLMRICERPYRKEAV